MTSPALPILSEALHASHGLLLKVDDFDRARRELYAARKGSGDGRLNVLMFRGTGGAFEQEGGNLLILKMAHRNKGS